MKYLQKTPGKVSVDANLLLILKILQIFLDKTFNYIVRCLESKNLGQQILFTGKIQILEVPSLHFLS